MEVLRTSLLHVRGRSKKTSCRDIIEAEKASLRKGIYEVLRTGMAAMTHLLILRKSSIWPRRAEDILTVVVVDIGPWVLPLSFNCSLAPFPSTLQRIGWGYSSKKSNPRLPRQTKANRTIHTYKVTSVGHLFTVHII